MVSIELNSGPSAFSGALLVLSVVLGIASIASAAPMQEVDMDGQVGQPVNIASSAYQYRADRHASENPPESWLALMHCANLPLNEPLEMNAPAIKQALCGLLWEEIRPVRTVELTWADDARRRPSPDALVLTTLDNQGASSSWWNNLSPVRQAVKPVVSGAGNMYAYDLRKNTCGLVISVAGEAIGSDYDVPEVRVLVADVWKTMDVEIEWGFAEKTAGNDYSGRVETYDGVVGGLRSLAGDAGTVVVDQRSWRSVAGGVRRRGVAFSLLYMGTSTWRKVQPFTSQADDVARTIVTLWTEAGNVSFLAGDLENGPILMPEYGFFARRTSELAPPATQAPVDLRVPRLPLSPKMTAIAGASGLLGWGSDATPWFGGNPGFDAVSVQGITIPAYRVAMHPGAALDVAVGWRSPIKATVNVRAGVAHGQVGSNGIDWWIARETGTERQNLAHGSTDGSGAPATPADTEPIVVDGITVEPGDMLSLVVGPKGSHTCDTTIIELVITEQGEPGRIWGLTQDTVSSLHAGNPHADGQGHADVWHFYAEKAAAASPVPSEPPFALASQAASAREFVKDLQSRKLTTLRQQIRAHEEQTWEGATYGMHGPGLPPHPKPPAGSEPLMQVEVPSERLTAQWNLGMWHLVRHCEKNPANGRLWFNDFPYGILAAETYMVLAALDLMGSHQAAEDGFDQWVALPLNPSSAGHHPWALPDRPNGLFSEGRGCLTHAVGPDGYGGHMDGVHAFGPGSIGWALTEHYWLTGDAKWLRASAPRIKANAEWMLRQRAVLANLLPGGERLWCKGLQPALQVTPDSGGLWMQFYECEAYYWASVSRLAATLGVIDADAGARLAAEAEAYRRDLRAAVERSIALSPVVPVRDGTFHSVVPFACYVRGLGTGAWGWERDGSGSHVGPLYWETVQSAAALISPAGLLPADDVRVQGYLDVLEDRLLLENPNACQKDWFLAGWQYQGGLERTANMHLAGDDVPVFLRSFLNCYAVDILPNDGYIFNEHAVHGPPDKIFEEAAFLERFRNLLVMEEASTLWLTRAAPRAWLEQGKKIAFRNAPTHFGTVNCEIISDVDNGRITATVNLKRRNPPDKVMLRVRHPRAAQIQRVQVNGEVWQDFDASRDVVILPNVEGKLTVDLMYTP